MDANHAIPSLEPLDVNGRSVAGAPQMVQSNIPSLFGNGSSNESRPSQWKHLSRSRPVSFRWGLSAFLPSSLGSQEVETQPSTTTFEYAGERFTASSPVASFDYCLPSPASTTGTTAPLLTNRTDSQQLAAVILRKTELRHQRAWKRKSRNNRAESNWASRIKVMDSRRFLCLIFGVFLVTVITTYFALIISLKSLSVPLNIAFILLLIISTILFIHSILRLCLHRYRPHRSRHQQAHQTHSHLHRHYRRQSRKSVRQPSRLSYPPNILHPSDLIPKANVLYTPTTPVRVHLARDDELEFDHEVDADLEEAGLISPLSPVFSPLNPDSSAAPPPAYGLWRCSVRADPDLLHWARVGEVTAGPRIVQAQEAGTARTGLGSSAAGRSRVSAPVMSSTAVPRPPSYASDDGVQYVVGGRSGPRTSGDGRLFGAIDVGGNGIGGAPVPNGGEPQRPVIDLQASMEEDWPLRSATYSPPTPAAMSAASMDARVADAVRESEAVMLATRRLLEE